MSVTRMADTRIGAVVHVDNFTGDKDPGLARHMAHTDLVRQLSNHIAQHMATVTRRDRHTEHRIELYVLSPDQIFELIQREAMQMMQHMGPRQ